MSRPDIYILQSLEDSVHTFLSDTDAWIRYEETDAQNIRASIAEYAKKQILPLMKDMSVDELARLKQNLRITALKESGFLSLADILQSTKKQLADVNGISVETAEYLLSACESIQKDIAASSHFKLKTEPEMTEILRSIHTLLGHEKMVVRASSLSERYRDRLTACLEEIQPLKKNSFAWFFVSGRKKKEALSAFEELQEITSSDAFRILDTLHDEEKNLREITGQQLFEDYRTRPAVYEKVLIEQDDRFVDYDTIEGGIPSQMAAEINRLELHTDLLKAELRSYQTFGVKYILTQKNVLLGDEMGLGKTVEAIAAMTHLAANGAMHFMVVCPAGVLINWNREILHHSRLTPVMIHGRDMNALEEWLRYGGIAVTTYESISKFDLPEDFEMEMITADEAQYIKNPNARRTQRFRKFSLQAKRTLYMTGTPLENRVDEMCELIRALQPNVALELESRKYLAAAPLFKELAAPVYLRRRREDVLNELPDIIYTDEWCELSLSERMQYMQDVRDGAFNRMRRVSWIRADLFSTKANRLKELVETAKEEGRRVLVFSWFLDTVCTVRSLLNDSCTGVITGAVRPAERQEIIDRFSEAPPGSVLIMQAMAGGIGLNIQSASMIIFAEPQIKPSIEQQSISRAYRMGQTRTVTVHRLLAVNTIDEAMCEMLERKQEIFDAFADESVMAEEELNTAEQSAWIQSIIRKEQEKLQDELM